MGKIPKFSGMMTPLIHLLQGVVLFLAFPLTSCSHMDRIEDFGPNPGGLNMYVHLPEGLSQPAPVVVAMHGCLQSADTYANETGWNDLADKHGFIVVYPEQRLGNNSKNCFSWFEEGDINRDQGEALSIRSMVAYAVDTYGADPGRIYVTGLSAGGCMTAVMLATYPEIFDAGAVIAGIPYKATTTVEGAVPAMRGEIDQTPDQWATLVTEQNPGYPGPYPRIAIFHGSEDVVVSRQNMIELVDQWTQVHTLPADSAVEQAGFDNNPNVTQRSYQRAGEAPAVITYEIAEMGHALAVDPGQGPRQGGATGMFAVDVDFFCTYWAAHFFGLVE